MLSATVQASLMAISWGVWAKALWVHENLAGLKAGKNRMSTSLPALIVSFIFHMAITLLILGDLHWTFVGTIMVGVSYLSIVTHKMNQIEILPDLTNYRDISGIRK